MENGTWQLVFRRSFLIVSPPRPISLPISLAAIWKTTLSVLDGSTRNFFVSLLLLDLFKQSLAATAVVVAEQSSSQSSSDMVLELAIFLQRILIFDCDLRKRKLTIVISWNLSVENFRENKSAVAWAWSVQLRFHRNFGDVKNQLFLDFIANSR